MKFSNLHLNESILRGVSFEPTMMCPCGCNEPMVMGVEGGNSHETMTSLIGAYYEETQCEHVLGVLRTIDKETHIIFLDTEDMNFKMCNVGTQTPKQLGKTIEGFIKSTTVHYVILAEEIKEGGIVIVSNKKEVMAH